jgi:hypothetical protein
MKRSGDVTAAAVLRHAPVSAPAGEKKLVGGEGLQIAHFQWLMENPTLDDFSVQKKVLDRFRERA